MKITYIAISALLLLTAVTGFNTGRKTEAEDDDWMRIIRGVSNETGKTEEFIMKAIKEMFNHKTVFSPEKRSFSASCFVCNSLVSVLTSLLSIISDETAISMVQGLCSGLGLFPASVCDTTIATQGEILLYVARKTDATPMLQELCSNFLKTDCDGSKGEEWLIELPDVPKPPVDPIPAPEAGKPTLKVLQLSDFHLDPIYQEGSAAECDEPLCCRGPVIGPPGNGSTGGAGTWASYKCDASIPFVENMLKQIVEKHEDIDYVFLIGDGPAHDFWQQNKTVFLENLILSNDLVRKGLPGKRVFPLIGNHDSYPVNNFHPRDEELAGHELFDNQWLLDAMWEDWTKEWLPNELENENDFFYSTQLFPGLRLIALNSNYMYALNWWNIYYKEDPSGQLAWFVKELQAAEDAGDKVQLLIHQPPGADAFKTYSHNFWRIVKRYESTIRGIFAGHTHTNEFQLMYDDEDPERAFSLVYVGPSVTPFTDLNPAYRIFTIDGNYEGSTYAILDYEDYYVDLTTINSGVEPNYQKLYSPKEAYGMKSLNPQDWKEVVDKFVEEEEMFDKYYEYWHRSAPTQPECGPECRRDHICYIMGADSSNYEHCDNLPYF